MVTGAHDTHGDAFLKAYLKVRVSGPESGNSAQELLTSDFLLCEWGVSLWTSPGVPDLDPVVRTL